MAFQNSAFQSNAYQVSGTASATPGASNWYPLKHSKETYTYHYIKYKDEQAQRDKIAQEREALELVEQELADKERERLRKLSQARNAAKKAALEARLQEEINKLRIERVWLMRRIDDEETILVLMMLKKRRSI